MVGVYFVGIYIRTDRNPRANTRFFLVKRGFLGELLLNRVFSCNRTLFLSDGPLAQLDRALDYESMTPRFVLEQVSINHLIRGQPISPLPILDFHRLWSSGFLGNCGQGFSTPSFPAQLTGHSSPDPLVPKLDISKYGRRPDRFPLRRASSNSAHTRSRITNAPSVVVSLRSK